MQRKNTYVLTAEHHLAKWFIKGTARNTEWHTTLLQAVYTTLLQAVFVRHSYFGDFWVAPRIINVSPFEHNHKQQHNTTQQSKFWVSARCSVFKYTSDFMLQIHFMLKV